MYVYMYICIVRKGVPAPSFLRHPPLKPACPLFKIFVSTLLFSIPPPFKVFQTILPTPNAENCPSCPNPTHQPSLHLHTVSFLDNLE